MALLCAQPDETIVRVKLDALTLEDAERLDGKTVVTTFTAGKRCSTWVAGKTLPTVTAPAGGRGVERTVILKGNRLHDADMGARLTVVGALRVIRHQDAVISSRAFAGFTEIRIEEPRTR